MKRNLTTSFLENIICKETIRLLLFEGIKEWLVTPLYGPCCYLKHCFTWRLFSRSQYLKPDWFLPKETPKGSWGRSEVFPLLVVVTLRQFHGMRQSESDANKTAFWFQNLISPPEMYARVKYAYSGSWDISCHAHVYVNHMEQRKHLTATNWKDSSPNKISKQRILDMNKIEQIISCLSLLILLSSFAFRLHCKVFKVPFQSLQLSERLTCDSGVIISVTQWVGSFSKIQFPVKQKMGQRSLGKVL